ncbi:ABC-type Fe3+-siderophore transport system, permease component [Leucobacter sp. 7(1)]|uniref:FecCD family ABC transporter permease n=1 Tax=Leucobacter sp. 7(1) TaxID=1255613 RepID=UPI00097EEAD5|nr:iron chelate uptake ABC transporter family permease subunit [Leucobacter sp. 7(1)]SJN12477.1 ABC-type Fe3+-siderophore transport system, permease component [Leucobacter sp. 7(1)]
MSISARPAPPTASTLASAEAPAAPASSAALAAASRPGLVRGAGPRIGWLLLATVGLLGVTVLSVIVGARDLPLATVWEAVISRQAIETHYVVWDLRIPRTLVAIVVGASLGVAGALVQALTRNPLADPGILGVNSGAAFAVTVGVGVFGLSSVVSTIWFAFGGALIVTVAVYAIGAAGRGGADPMRLVLAGVALGAALSGATSALTLLDPSAFDKLRNWGAGSVVGRELTQVWPVLPFLAVGIVLALCMAQTLNAIALGEDLASALGANVLRTRIIVIIAVTLLAGGATAIAGPIGFIGLMVPHVARWITGPDQRWILAFTLVLAPILLLLADIAGRILMRPAEIPVGIVTAFIGAPVLIFLIRRRRLSQL